MKRELLGLLAVGILVAAPLGAQEDEPQDLSPDEIAEAEKEGKVRLEEEITVVSASKVESRLVDAPATMSVITAQQLEANPAQNYADLFRSVPGVNAIQLSARDVNLTSRQSTSSLSNSQLVLVDGRAVNTEFFGNVFWDLVPDPNSNQVKQVEIVRGPASIVWGANALAGVVNIITKSPRESPGFGFNLSAGLFNRDGGSRQADGNGHSYSGNVLYSSPINDSWSWRLNAGYLDADPYSRPEGIVPLSCHALGASPCRDEDGDALPGGFPIGGALYPGDSPGLGNQWVNLGTSQPKFDLRFDQELGDDSRIIYQGGYAGTSGIIHTVIGPLDVRDETYMAYGKVQYQKGAMRFGGYFNRFDSLAPNLLQIDPNTLGPVLIDFKNSTFDIEFVNTSVIGGRHAVTYGGNYRRNSFDISAAPNAEDRNELGAYIQEEFFIDKFRLAAGIRADKFGNLDKVVFSPRVSIMFKPTPDQSIRASFNRAFRSPPVIANYIDLDVSLPDPTVDLRPLAPFFPPPVASLIPNEPFFLTINSFGDTGLQEESIDEFEIAYTGVIGGRTTIGLAVYQSDTDDNITFSILLPNQEFPMGLPGLEFYSPTIPAEGIGTETLTPIQLDPILMGALAQVPPPFGPILLPWKAASFLNFGPIRNRGVEAWLSHRVNNSGDHLRQLLVAEDSRDPRRGRRPDPLPDSVGADPSQEPLQCRHQLQRAAVPGRRQRQLCGRGALDGRAGPRVPRLHRLVHDAECDLRGEVRRPQGHRLAQGHEPHEREHHAARLRRRPREVGRGRGELLRPVTPS